MSTTGRRSVLKALGLGTAAASLPLYRLFDSDIVRADTSSTGGPPLRFLAVWFPHGTVRDRWLPRGGEHDFDITYPGAILSPLEPYRDRLLVLSGLDYKVCYEKGGNGHPGGHISGLTGSRVIDGGHLPDARPEYESIDVRLAREIGEGCPFRSLETGVTWGSDFRNHLSFAADGSPLPYEHQPDQLFARVFGDFTAPGSDPEATEAAMRRLRQRRSVLDYVNRDLARLERRLAGAERAKLQSHLEALRSIERRLSESSGDGSAGDAVCTVPDAPEELRNGQNPSPRFQLHADILAQAFACDRTRVASLRVDRNQLYVPYDGNFHTEVTHNMHIAENREMQAEYHRLCYEDLAYFLGSLDAIPEADGTVLDHTLVLCLTELDNPSSHSNINVPCVIAGGTNGQLRMGRHLQYDVIDSNGDDDFLEKGFDDDGTIGDRSGDAGRLTAHNQLLVSICRAFGIDTDTYGDPDYTGPLPGLV